MPRKWSDSLDIAIDLSEKYPDNDPKYIRFIDLYKCLISLENLYDYPDNSHEKILESIKINWNEEEKYCKIL